MQSLDGVFWVFNIFQSLQNLEGTLLTNAVKFNVTMKA